MADARRLVELSMVPELAKEVASQIDAAGSPSPDDIQVPEITSGTFTFAGGTLTEFMQAVADDLGAA